MKVVLADVDAPSRSTRPSTSCGRDGLDVTGVVTDVTDFASVEALRDAALRRLRRRPRAVQQRRRRRRRRRPDLGPHAQRLALGARRELWGVIHGIKAFVPGDARRRRRGPRRQHVVGQRRHRPAAGHADLRRSPRRRSSRSPSRSTRSCGRSTRRIGASVLFPGPERAAHRPVRRRGATGPTSAPTTRRATTPYTTIESFEKPHAPTRASSSTTRRSRRSPTESSTRIRDDRFWILPAERAQPTSRSRARAAVDARPAPTRPTSATWEADHERCDRYLVISADCHAGLPERAVPRVARPGVPRALRRDPRRPRPDDASSRSAGILNEEFAEEWDEENEEGLRGGWDAARRDKELDADGVVGEVIFPDADAVTGGASAPFGAGLGVERRHADRPAAWPAPGPTTAGWPSCARTAPSGAPAWRSCRSCRRRRRGRRDPPGPRVRAAGRHPHPVDVGSRTRRTTTPRYDPVWAACEDLQMPVHVHSGVGRQGGRTGRTSASTPPRSAGGRPGRCGSCSGRACSSATPACGSASPSAARSGRPTCSGRWTLVYDREHGATKLGEQLTAGHVDAPERVLRPQLLHRRVEHPPPRAGPPLRDRRRQPHVGQRLPPPRGHVAAHAGVPARRVLRHPRRRDRGDARRQRRRGLRLRRRPRCAPLADRIGPTPAELGQDGADLAEVGRAAKRPAARGSPASRRSPPASVRDRDRRSAFDPFEPGFDAWPYEQYRRLREAEPVHWSELLSGWVLTRFDDVSPRPARPLGQQRHRQGEAAPVVDLLRARSARNAAQATGMTLVLHRRPRPRPRPQAHARAVHRPLDRASCVTRCSERVDAHLDRLAPKGRGRPHRRLRVPAAGRGVLRHARRPGRGGPAVPGVDRCGGPQPRPRHQRGGLRRAAWSCSRRCRSTCPTRPTRSGPRRPTTCCRSWCTPRTTASGSPTTSSCRSSSRSTWPATSRRPRSSATGSSPCSRHPEQLAALQADPSWCRTPCSSCCATTARTSSCAGSPPPRWRSAAATIADGDVLYLCVGAANHDPERWGDDADRLRVDRPDAGQHLQFGGGIHPCLGAHLARLQAEVALTSLLTRLPRLRPGRRAHLGRPHHPPQRQHRPDRVRLTPPTCVLACGSPPTEIAATRNRGRRVSATSSRGRASRGRPGGPRRCPRSRGGGPCSPARCGRRP